MRDNKTQGRWWGNWKPLFVPVFLLGKLRGDYTQGTVQPKQSVASSPSSKWHTVEVLEDLEWGYQNDEKPGGPWFLDTIAGHPVTWSLQGHNHGDSMDWENSKPTRRLLLPNQEDRYSLPCIVSYHLGKEREKRKPFQTGRNLKWPAKRH